MGKSWLFDIKLIANTTFFTKCYKNQFVKFAMFHQIFITLQTSLTQIFIAGAVSPDENKFTNY